MILIIIKFCEILLRISPRIINSLRSYIKHSKECFLLFPNTSKLVKKNSAAPRFSNQLLGVWKSEETLFLVFDILLSTQHRLCWRRHLSHVLVIVAPGNEFSRRATVARGKCPTPFNNWKQWLIIENPDRKTQVLQVGGLDLALINTPTPTPTTTTIMETAI